MDLSHILTQKINWESLPVNELKGERGSTLYRDITSGGFRIRLAEYSANYKSANACIKGHIIHCIQGIIDMHLNDKTLRLRTGDSILLKDGDSHTATTENNSALLFIIDKE